MKKRGQLDLVWQPVPDDVDILLTHGPPKGVLDITHDVESKKLVQVGCAALRRHVEERIKPKIHAFGHLHEEKGSSASLLLSACSRRPSGPLPTRVLKSKQKNYSLTQTPRHEH